MFELSLGPFMPVEPQPDRIGRIRVRFPEGTSLRVPQVEVEMVDEHHLPAPVHVGCGRFSCPFRGHERHADAFSWPMPIKTAFVNEIWPPSDTEIWPPCG